MAIDPKQVQAAFLEVVQAAPAERFAILDRVCAGDAELRRRVELLVRAHDDSGDLPPAGDAVAGTEAHESNSAPTEPRSDLQAGSIFAERFKLREKLGEGGMGIVWVADQIAPVQRRVALKVIKSADDSGRLLARFEQERQALAVMDHPNIAKVLDAGVSDEGRPYFVMELIKGVPLTKYCDEAKLTPKERLELFVPVCQAVQHAHQKGIIHRDLKPSNILVGLYDGRPVPKVIDFGVAKATGPALSEQSIYTEVGALIGTLEYMSPEQAELNNLDIDTRSDIYALGVILYELLTGGVPFSRRVLKAAGFAEMLRIIKEVEPPKPSTRLSGSGTLPTVAAVRNTEPSKLTRLVRGELDWIVMKCLEKDRGRRYETANGLTMDIQRYLADEPVAAGPPSASYRLRKFARRNKPQVIAAALVVLALLAGIAGTTWGLVEARSQRDRAEQAAAKEKAANAQAQKRLTQIEKANDILGSIFENLDPWEIARNERPLQAILVEKLDKAVEQLEGESIGDPLVVAAMQRKFGNSLFSLGEPGKATVLLEKARATLQAKLGPEHPYTLNDENSLARAYQAAGKLDLALPLFEETLILTKAKFGPEHPNTLISMQDLAQAYQAAGKMDQALPLFEETLKLMKAKLGLVHPNTLACMGNLAGAYQDDGKLDLALPLFEETLKLTKAKLGPEHPQTLACMGNLALSYQAAGKVDQALSIFEETLKLMKAKLGPEHPDTLSSMNNRASAYQAAGKLDQALPLLEETLKLRKAKLGPEHPDTLISMNNLAMAYEAAGKLDLALPLLEQTLKLKKAKLGPEHPNTLNSMYNFAFAYWRAKQFDKSILMFEETLKLQEAKLGREHPQTLQTAANLGVNYKDVGRLVEALPLLEEAHRAVKKYPVLRFADAALFDAYVQTGKTEQAVALATELLADARLQLPKESTQLAGQLAKTALLLLQAKALTEAEPLLRECLTIREKNRPDKWTTFNTKSMLGGALLGQKKYAEAEPLLLAGYEGMKQREAKIPPKGKVRLTEALERLVQVNEALEKKDEAAKWRKELEALEESSKQLKLDNPRPETSPGTQGK